MSFTVPEEELRFSASRAGGPGGQHVNKASTRVEVRWNVKESETLSESQRELLLQKLRSRLDTNGILRVVAGERRSQLRNREAAVQRLNELVQQALKKPRQRRKTTPSASAVQKRLDEKHHRSKLKRERKRPVTED
jgi:ribosome-associated protein